MVFASPNSLQEQEFPKLPILTVEMLSGFKILLPSPPTGSLAELTLYSYLSRPVRLVFIPDVTDVRESIYPVGMNRGR